MKKNKINPEIDLLFGPMNKFVGNLFLNKLVKLSFCVTLFFSMEKKISKLTCSLGQPMNGKLNKLVKLYIFLSIRFFIHHSFETGMGHCITCFITFV